MLFRKYGWSKALFIDPRYRYLSQKYNFDDYSSKGSAVHPVKRYNRVLTGRMAAIEGAEGPSTAGALVEGKSLNPYGSERICNQSQWFLNLLSNRALAAELAA